MGGVGTGMILDGSNLSFFGMANLGSCNGVARNAD
jgi:hypothetical protein